MSAAMKLLWLSLLAVFAIGSSGLLASPHHDDDDDDDDEDSRDSLMAEFGAIPPSKGSGDGQYMELQGNGSGGGISVVLNANARVALAKVDADGNVLFDLNTHLGITEENHGLASVTLFIGEDEDGDGTCLQEGPHAICELLGGDGDAEINDDGILHVAYKLALRTQGGTLRGDGICWTNFEDVQVTPLLDEAGNMIGVAFDVVGGEVGMPDIEDGDGSIVGFDAPWLSGTECGADTTCEVMPILTTDESYGTGGEVWQD